MKKLNNRGYVLIELIVSAIMAFGLGYYLINLTYNFADKNEELYLSNKMLSYKAIVTKNIMEDLDNKKINSVAFNTDRIIINGTYNGSNFVRIIKIDESNIIYYKDSISDNNIIFKKVFKDNIKIKKNGSYYYFYNNSDKTVSIVFYNIYVKENYSVKLLFNT